MKKKVAKLVSLILAVAMIALPGCSSGAATSSAPTETGSQQEASQGENTADQEPVSLVWATFKGEWADTLNELFAGYMEDHPEVKEITVYTAASGSGNLFTDMKAMLASNTLPNIFNMRADSFGREWKEYLQEVGDSEAVAATKEEFVEPFQWDGGTYGAYWNYEVQGIMWNMRLLEQVGVTETPKSLTEYKKTLEALKNGGINPLVCCFGTAVHFYNFWGVAPLGLDNSYADSYNGLVKGSIDPATDPSWAKYYDQLELNLQYCEENPLQVDNNMANLSFFNNEYAGYPSGGIQLATLAKEHNENFAKDFRVGPLCFDDEKPFYPVSVQGYCVSNQGDEATNKAALDLYNWFYTSDEVSETLTRQASVLRTSKTFVPTEDMLDEMTLAAFNDSAEATMVPGRYFTSDELNNEWVAVTQKFIAGEMTREEALAATGEVFRTYGKEV